MKHLILLTLLLSITYIALAQSGGLKGRVTSTDGEPVAAMNVAIHSLKLSTVTDEDGNYRLTGIKPGTYEVTFSHVGLTTSTRTITLTAGATAEVSFRIQQTARQLDEVVVKSDKTTIRKPVSFGKAGLSPLDNPQATGIVSNTVIRDQQAMRLGDVVKNVSGVALTQQRQGVAETFSARGYTIGVAGSTGGIFKNGIVSNTAGFPEASTLESIEVLKGSSALLYGNTSAGLIINMVTKRPKFDWGGEVSMNVGSFNTYKPVVDVYGPITDNLAFRVVGTYEHADSYRDQVHTQRKYVNPSLLYKLGKKTTILLQGDYLDANFSPDMGIGVLNQNIDVIIPASRSRYINTNWAYYHSRTASASAVITHQFSDNWKLNVIAGGQSVNIDTYGAGTPSAIDNQGNWNRALSRARSKEINSTLQADLTGSFKTGGIGHQVLIGTSYVQIKTQSDAFRLTSSTGAVGTAYDKINILDMSKYTQRTDIPNALDTGRTVSPNFNLGYYVQDLISIAPRWKVLAGLRWSYLETKAPFVYNYIKNTVTPGTAAYNNAFSPKGAIIFEPMHDMSVYVSYANSFTVNTGTDIYNKPLKPSIIDDYEMGWKSIFFQGKVAANVSVYRIRNSNLAQQAITLADGSPNTNTNIKELTGETTSDGFDVDISGTLSANLYFIAGYAYNYARYTHSPGNKGSVVEGEMLNNSPRNTVNTTLFYTFTNTALRGLKLGVSAFYTGRRYGGNQNTVGQTPVYNRQIELSDFTTVDLSAGYAFRKLSIQARLANVTNTLNYLVHDRYSINPIAPRSLMATVAYKF